MKYYFRAFKKYAVTEGRATRRELIWFSIFHWLVIRVFALLDLSLGFYSLGLPRNLGFLTLLYLLLTACPLICLQVRRLHDVGKSGSWWWLFSIFPLTLYLYFKAGDFWENDFDPSCDENPPAEEAAEAQPVKQEAPCPPVPSVPVPVEVCKPHFCRKCGETLNDGSNFCHKCGTEVVEIPQ